MNGDAPLAPVEPARVRAARLAGYVVQALVLGVLLAFACVQLFVLSGGAAVFRYQGF